MNTIVRTNQDAGISILILTLNEEANLPACLESVKWSDDIVMLDSYSSDRTCYIAKDFGARILQRQFDDWSSHYNWAMEQIVFKHRWVFNLDADERMTEAVREEAQRIANDGQRQEVAYYCGRKNYFMGKWIKHAMPPGKLMRLFRPQYIRFKRLVNPVPLIDGRFGYLSNYIGHYNFSKGIAEWFDKHNRYSSFEAIEGRKVLRQGSYELAEMCSLNALVRRRALKKYAARLPFRAILKFFYLYLWNLGFLDGRAGFRYSLLQSIYEHMIVLKIDELQRKEKGLPV
ncbi:MAG TPA: glycosyltransferase family 2 protein [Nitrospira sp.]|nr:glycosyltransferase family 2 protein [Nitrospira sp.]